MCVSSPLLSSQVQTKHVRLRSLFTVFRQADRQEVGWAMRTSPTAPEINGSAAKWRKERPQMSHRREAQQCRVWNTFPRCMCLQKKKKACACVSVFLVMSVHVQACVWLCVVLGVTGGRYAMSWLTRVLLCCSVLHDWPSAVRGHRPSPLTPEH